MWGHSGGYRSERAPQQGSWDWSGGDIWLNEIGLSLLFGILKVYRGQDGDRGELKYRLQGKDIFIGHQLRLVSRRG